MSLKFCRLLFNDSKSCQIFKQNNKCFEAGLVQVFTTVQAGAGRFLKIKTNYLISKLLFQTLKHLEIQFEFPSQIFV
jgi:hypothetical protein